MKIERVIPFLFFCIIILLVDPAFCQEELRNPAIIFYSDSAEQPGIYLIVLEFSRRPIFLGQGEDPVWSPDGEKIAFCDNGIGIMDADGRNRKMLTFNPSDRKPVFSPDENKIDYRLQESRLSLLFSSNPFFTHIYIDANIKFILFR